MIGKNITENLIIKKKLLKNVKNKILIGKEILKLLPKKRSINSITLERYFQILKDFIMEKELFANIKKWLNRLQVNNVLMDVRVLKASKNLQLVVVQIQSAKELHIQITEIQNGDIKLDLKMRYLNLRLKKLLTSEARLKDLIKVVQVLVAQAQVVLQQKQEHVMSLLPEFKNLQKLKLEIIIILASTQNLKELIKEHLLNLMNLILHKIQKMLLMSVVVKQDVMEFNIQTKHTVYNKEVKLISEKKTKFLTFQLIKKKLNRILPQLEQILVKKKEMWQ